MRVTNLGLQSNPNLHRASNWPIQSADRSTATVGGVDQSFQKAIPIWDEASLNCVSLRPELKCELIWRDVKGQDERPFGAPLTSLQIVDRTIAQVAKE
jgi:hypothetical protein